MVYYMSVVVQIAVVNHLSVFLNQRHSQSREAVTSHISVESVLVHAVGVVHPFAHAFVVVLQPCVERLNLILILAHLLEHYERYGEKQEYGQHAEVNPVAYAYVPNTP